VRGCQQVAAAEIAESSKGSPLSPLGLGNTPAGIFDTSDQLASKLSQQFEHWLLGCP